MRRVIWFTVGATVAVVAVVGVQRLYRRSTPQAIQEQVNEAATDAMGAARRFVNVFSSSMAQREHELRDALGMDEVPEAAARPTAAVARSSR